jgi:hypothetical protein
VRCSTCRYKTWPPYGAMVRRLKRHRDNRLRQSSSATLPILRTGPCLRSSRLTCQSRPACGLCVVSPDVADCQQPLVLPSSLGASSVPPLRSAFTNALSCRESVAVASAVNSLQAPRCPFRAPVPTVPVDRTGMTLSARIDSAHQARVVVAKPRGIRNAPIQSGPLDGLLDRAVQGGPGGRHQGPAPTPTRAEPPAGSPRLRPSQRPSRCRRAAGG